MNDQNTCDFNEFENFFDIFGKKFFIKMSKKVLKNNILIGIINLNYYILKVSNLEITKERGEDIEK